MRRREFIAGLGAVGTYAALPRVARAQQDTRVRRIGILIDWAEADLEAKAALSAFSRGLSELGWTNERNVRMDVRFGSSDVDRMRALAKELVGLQPDAILANSTPATAAFQRVTRTIPIVFMTVSDPVGSGFVASLPRLVPDGYFRFTDQHRRLLRALRFEWPEPQHLWIGVDGGYPVPTVRFKCPFGDMTAFEIDMAAIPAETDQARAPNC